MKLDRVDLVTAGANPGAHVMIAKFESPDIVVDKHAETPDVQPDGVEADMADVTDVETVAKADFEAVQKQLEDMRKALEDAQAAQAAEAEKVAKMEQDRKAAEFVAKAAEFDRIGKADELGAVLLEAADGMSAEAYSLLERTLKAANEQLAKGSLFAQFSQPEGDSPEVGDRITDLAKAKVAAGAAKTLEIAKLQVMQENPELQSEYISARDSAR